MAKRTALNTAFAEAFGPFIRWERHAQDRPQKEICDTIGVRQSSYSQWEKGQCLPTVPMFLKLIRELDINIADIYGVLDGVDGNAAEGEAA